MTGQLSG